MQNVVFNLYSFKPPPALARPPPKNPISTAYHSVLKPIFCIALNRPPPKNTSAQHIIAYVCEINIECRPLVYFLCGSPTFVDMSNKSILHTRISFYSYKVWSYYYYQKHLRALKVPQVESDASTDILFLYSVAINCQNELQLTYRHFQCLYYCIILPPTPPPCFGARLYPWENWDGWLPRSEGLREHDFRLHDFRVCRFAAQPHTLGSADRRALRAQKKIKLKKLFYKRNTFKQNV